MIYIVSGASRSGKSIIAKRFLQRNHVPYMPLDSMMMGFMNGVPSMGIHDRLWPHEIAEKMWPFLEAMCENMLNNKIDYLFEGEAVWPQYIKGFADRHPGQVRICFLGFVDVDIPSKVSDVKRYQKKKSEIILKI